MVPIERLEAMASEMLKQARGKLPETASVIIVVCDEEEDGGKLQWVVSYHQRNPLSMLRLIGKIHRWIERRILGE